MSPVGAGAGRADARSHLSPALPGARGDGTIQRDRAGRTVLARTVLASTGGGRAEDEAGVQLKVWTHSQGVYPLRRELARALELTEDQVRVRHVEGAGCYGHNAADDAAMDAALLALAVPGRPVQVVWSRADELGWEPYGPAAVVRVAADVDAAVTCCPGGTRSGATVT